MSGPQTHARERGRLRARSGRSEVRARRVVRVLVVVCAFVVSGVAAAPALASTDTLTTVTNPDNPSVFGQEVTLTATVASVSAGAGTPTGVVTFFDGGTALPAGAVQLDASGVATFAYTPAVAPASHTITAAYGGDGTFNSSTGSLVQTVIKADTSVGIASSQNPSPVGQLVTFTATVVAAPPGAGTPSGTVTFFDGSSSIGTGTLAGGVATLTPLPLTAGNHTITASYGGDADFNAASGSLAGNPQVITSPDATAPTTTIALSPLSANGMNGWYVTPVGVTVSATDPDDQVSQTRCVLDPAVVPQSFNDLPSSPCAITSVSSDGQHTLYAASVDSNGNEETPVSVSLKIDQTPPSLAPTLSTTTVVLGQSGVTASPNATDTGSGVASATCGPVNTSTAGVHTVSCNATDEAGNTNSATLSYTVQYQALGFFSPAAGSSWKLGKGAKVPIDIALADANGTTISNSQASVLANACRVTFSAGGAQTEPAQCMTYDAKHHQFAFNWVLAKRGTGPQTITVTVSYPSTSTATTKSESITITS